MAGWPSYTTKIKVCAGVGWAGFQQNPALSRPAPSFAMKTLQIYEDLVQLNRDEHRTLKLAPVRAAYAFARNTNSVVISASELAMAALDFPCVFVQSTDGHALAALMGLRNQENLFVQPDGNWVRNVYQPAFLRRYPFVLGEDEAFSNFTVYLDRAYAGFDTETGDPLFDADGKETKLLEDVKHFLVDYRNRVLATRDFANHLASLGLLQEGTIEYKFENNEVISLNGFKTIDEAKLHALDAATLKDFATRGWLGLIYAHLLSLNQVQRLAQRLDDRNQSDAATTSR